MLINSSQLLRLNQDPARAGARGTMRAMRAIWNQNLPRKPLMTCPWLKQTPSNHILYIIYYILYVIYYTSYIVYYILDIRYHILYIIYYILYIIYYILLFFPKLLPSRKIIFWNYLRITVTARGGPAN